MLVIILDVFFFKQKTAYEMRISDWSSYVCSSDLPEPFRDIPEKYRHEHNESRAEETTDHRAQPANDHNEKQLQRTAKVERQRPPGAEVHIGPQSAGHPYQEQDHPGTGKTGEHGGKHEHTRANVNSA